MTLPEILVAMVLLLIGVMATFVMLDVANGQASKASAREGATNLAREVLETAHQRQYSQVGGTGWFQTALQAIPNGSGSVTSSGAFATNNYAQATTVSRRNVTYTLSVSACSVDDGRDNYGSHPATANWCADSTSTGVSDGQPEDLKRVTTRVSWTMGGKAEQILQTATFSSNGAAVGPNTSALTISNPSQYSGLPNPVVTSNPAPSPPGNVTFTATSVGAFDMKFTVNGVEQTTGVTNLGNGTWTFAWPITNLPDATFSVAAVAIDALGTRGQPRSLPVQLNRGTPAGLTNIAGGYNYVWTNTSPYNNPPSGQKALVVELRWDASAEGSVTGYEVVRSGSTVCGGSTSLATECIDLNPASSGTSTYTLKTWYRDSSGNLQSISTTYNVTAPGGAAFPTQYWHTSGTSISTTKCLATSSVTSGIRRDAVSTYVPGTEQTFSNAAGGNGFIGCMPPFTGTVTMPATTNGMQVSAYFRNAGTGTVGCNMGWQVFKNGSVVNGVAGSGYGGSPATGFTIPPNQTQPTLVTLNLSTTAQTFVATDQLSIVIAGFNANTSTSKCQSTTLYYNSSAHPVSTVLPLTGPSGGGVALAQPAAPTGLTVSVDPTDGTRTLTWNAATGTPAPDFYRIYRDGQKYVSRVDTTGDTGSATVSWTDTASGGTSHTYYVTTVADTMAESASMVSVTG
jgi:Tfp pilus assembly protein PilV